MTNAALNSTEARTQPSSRAESAHDILRARRNPLDSIFSPKIVAVIGATERKRSVGRTVGVRTYMFS